MYLNTHTIFDDLESHNDAELMVELTVVIDGDTNVENCNWW